MGWAGSAYQYGILATHWYWIGAIPAMLFLGIVMMPFYYISKTHSVPGYLQLALRRRRARPGRRQLRAHDHPHVRRQHVCHGCRDAAQCWAGTSRSASGSAPSRSAIYVMLGGLRSAIINEVLQFVLIWARRRADPDPRPHRSGRLDGSSKANIAHNVGSNDYTHLWSYPRPLQRQPHGHPLDRHGLRPRRDHQLRLLDDRLPRRPARAERQQPARSQDGPGHRRGIQNGSCRSSSSSPA